MEYKRLVKCTCCSWNLCFGCCTNCRKQRAARRVYQLEDEGEEEEFKFEPKSSESEKEEEDDQDVTPKVIRRRGSTESTTIDKKEETDNTLDGARNSYKIKYGECIKRIKSLES